MDYPKQLYINLSDVLEEFRELMIPLEPDEEIPEEDDSDSILLSLDDIAVPGLVAAALGANAASFFHGADMTLDFKQPVIAIRLTGEFTRLQLETFRMLREVEPDDNGTDQLEI